MGFSSNFKQTLKTLTIILTFLYFAPSFGQKLPQRNGAVEIKKIHHQFLKNKDFEPSANITNKQNRPNTVLYFDSSGNLIEQVGYGKHHNTDLRILDYIVTNKYANKKIVESIRYEADYNKNISPESKTLYSYNDKNQLVKESYVDFNTDTTILQFQYEYDLSGNETKTLMSPTYYYKKTYDSSSKRISLQQIFDNKLRWEYTYTYTDTSRIGNFKTFYNDGKDYTKQQIDIYRDGKIIQTTEKYTGQDGLSEMTKYYYDKIGLLNKIEYYISYSSDSIFKLEHYTDISLKNKIELSKLSIGKINETILDD
jgi:hypothetical protein